MVFGFGDFYSFFLKKVRIEVVGLFGLGLGFDVVSRYVVFIN